MLPDGIVQLHVTARCNLACAMCYTASGPDRIEALPLAVACAALDDAAAAGYHTLSLSGGEPTLYRDLDALLRHARSLGLSTQMVSHGMGIDARVAARLAPLLDRLAISVDGDADAHDASRGRRGAHARMRRGIVAAIAAGLPTALLMTVTRRNFPAIDAVVEFAIDVGAAGLQLHPIERAGRARAGCDDLFLDERMRARLFLWFHLARARLAGRIALQLDLLAWPDARHRSPLARPVLVVDASQRVTWHAHRDDVDAVPAGDLRVERVADIIARRQRDARAPAATTLAALVPHWRRP